MKRKYLVCYDYGTGGVWKVVLADSADAITDRFPELVVVYSRPDWMTEEDLERLDDNAYDIDTPPDSWFALLERKRS